MNLELLLDDKYEGCKSEKPSKKIDLYKDVENDKLKYIFAQIHENFNRLFDEMFDRINSKNLHFLAGQSRDLIWWIKFYKELEYNLRNSIYAFELNEDYKKLIEDSLVFLVNSGGSSITEDFKIITILNYNPIFKLKSTITIPNNPNTYTKKLIGEGSYARVFKYKDEFYDKNVVIKRAKINELDSKEMERFRKEFITMKNLNSPYVVDVYRYDEEKHEYYMECADFTLKKYIQENSNKISNVQRRKIALQIFRGLEYIHSKKYLHRDLSLTNILIFKYDDVIIAKFSDFGLVKEYNSDLTNTNSDFKGSLNERNVQIGAFKNYKIEHEIYALTQLVFFVMTGKSNMEHISDTRIRNFVNKGMNSDFKKRYHSIGEIEKAFKECFSDS